ncbi:hypothetical protein FNV43_RR10518 [Rhamnella rubrinervis]|uniref:Uncharacterized protein n=1 Tax=Rhamnella rubrinervis TaxID=2594499 RepID=A0A8K0MGW1_9ROSA|nr:hypothetical protein FNV43_RR10518 [Rhamnella rubrinervis]
MAILQLPSSSSSSLFSSFPAVSKPQSPPFSLLRSASRRSSDADSLVDYDVSKIAAIYRLKPFLLVRRLFQIGTTFGKWFALRYVDRLMERSDQMFEVRAAELRKILVELCPCSLSFQHGSGEKSELITVDMRELIHFSPQTTTSTHTHSPPTATDTAAKGTTSTHTHSSPTATDDPGPALASNANVVSSHSLTLLLFMVAAITLQPSHGDSSTNPRPAPSDPDSSAIPQAR